MICNNVFLVEFDGVLEAMQREASGVEGSVEQGVPAACWAAFRAGHGMDPWCNL
jgi:hypothetical protein